MPTGVGSGFDIGRSQASMANPGRFCPGRGNGINSSQSGARAPLFCGLYLLATWETGRGVGDAAQFWSAFDRPCDLLARYYAIVGCLDTHRFLPIPGALQTSRGDSALGSSNQLGKPLVEFFYGNPFPFCGYYWSVSYPVALAKTPGMEKRESFFAPVYFW